MFVGVMELHFALLTGGGLKEKRSVVRRLAHRCSAKFNIAIAEVEDMDLTDRAVLGLVTVGNAHAHVQRMLDKVEDFIERLALAELLEAPKTIERY